MFCQINGENCLKNKQKTLPLSCHRKSCISQKLFSAFHFSRGKPQRQHKLLLRKWDGRSTVCNQANKISNPLLFHFLRNKLCCVQGLPLEKLKAENGFRDIQLFLQQDRGRVFSFILGRFPHLFDKTFVLPLTFPQKS